MARHSSFRSPLARVRGLGAAKSGTEHFWLQRLTAVALVPLTLIFAIFVINLTGDPHAAVVAFLGQPLPAAVTVLLIVATCWHLKLGGQVVIEDYVHHEGAKLVSVMLLTFFCFAIATACLIAVLRMVVGA